MYNQSTSRYKTNYYNVKKFNDNYFEVVLLKYPVKNKGFESDRDVESFRTYDNKLDNSIARAKSRIFEYSMSNEFDYFITLTLDKNKYNRYDLDKFIKDFGQFVRNRRRKYQSNIQYLLIPERHKNGAWHLHGLIKNIPSDFLSVNENGYLDWYDYRKKFGYVSLSKVKNLEAVSRYITKYVTKDFDKGVTEKYKKMYYVTRGLKKSKKILEGSYNYSSIPSNVKKFENDYIIKMSFNNVDELKKVINIISQ